MFMVNYLPNYMASHPTGQQSSVTSATARIPDTECITKQQNIGGINIYMQMIVSYRCVIHFLNTCAISLIMRF
jgi:hypothetical protein